MGDKMLRKFSVKNFRNFNEKIKLDFTNKRDYQFNQNCIKDNLLNKLIVFGKNGSGKSNFGYALFDIVMTLTDKGISPELLSVNEFLNADSSSNIAEFCYEFKFENDIIKYSYSKSALQVIAYEELFINDLKIFSFDFNTKAGDFSNISKIGAESLKFEKEKLSFSFLRLIANNTIQDAESPIKKLLDFVNNMLWFRSLINNSYIGLTTDVVDVESWIIKNSLISELKTFLKDFAELNLDFNSLTLGNANVLLEKHKHRQLQFSTVKSSGTTALLIFFYWSRQFEKASFLFIDEFDAFYHYELAQKIIQYILDIGKIQAILTSHNTHLADNNLLRPDCLFQLENGKLMSFADSTDRELREGHNIEKMLRQGEFNE